MYYKYSNCLIVKSLIDYNWEKIKDVFIVSDRWKVCTILSICLKGDQQPMDS